MEIKKRVDKKTTKQVRIDAGLHELLKIKAATENTTIKALIEDSLSHFLSPLKGVGND